MANTFYKSLMIVLCALPLVCACGVASAGTATTADGDWSGAIWTSGQPDSLDIVTVQHNVTITQTGEIASGLNLDGGTIALSAGTLTLGNIGANQTFIGFTNGPGDVVQTGGTWTQGASAATLRIGGFTSNGEGTYTISGGTLDCSLTVLGVAFAGSGSGGTLTIEGNGGAITAFDFVVGGSQSNAPGTLVIRPTANGAAGLSPIIVSNVINLGTSLGDAILTVDPQYDVQVGDSWIVATFGSLNGGFATVNTPAGVEVSVVAARALERGVASGITVTVTAAITPVPAITTWGMALLLGLLLLAGHVAMRRVARMRSIA